MNRKSISFLLATGLFALSSLGYAGQDPSVEGASSRAESYEGQALAKGHAGSQLGLLEHPVLRLTGDLFFAQNLNGQPSTGLGASLRVEGQFFNWLSLGTYYDFSLYTGGGSSYLAGPWGLMGRIIPLRQEKMSFYLIGGLGINTLIQANRPTYPTSFHGFAGVGGSFTLDGPIGLDLNAVYNFYSPLANPLSAVAIRGGISYAIGL